MEPDHIEEESLPERKNCEFTAEEFSMATKILELVGADRGLLADVEESIRHQFLKAAGKVAYPGRAARRQLTNTFRARRRVEVANRKKQDEQLLSATGIRSQFQKARIQQGSPSAPFESPLPPPAELVEEECGPRLSDPRNCYTCKRDYDRVHHFYDSLCPDCAQLNWSKRNQTADAKGRYALVTGARVKIGFQAALKLLRAGCYVIVTTRFPRDATQRFLSEKDCDQWQEQLSIYGLDLRHTPSVEALCSHLNLKLPRLDFILNNACQTVRRPPGFYAHLMDTERQLAEKLPEAANRMLEEYESLRHGGTLISPDSHETQLPAEVVQSVIGIQRAAELSQIPLVAGDSATGAAFFPEGEFDHDLQQVDLRTVNSWRLKLADVPTVELLEVHLVNAVAPFLFNSRLKPLMLKVPTHDKHIVNVSAMEGVFYRAFKTDKHPHTNMAKAALNMLTRTSAQDYAGDGIFMNSVDTGWITDEDPAVHADRKQKELGFHPPLDIVDAAARICDPFFHGLLTGEHAWGKFLKDYQIANW